MCDDENEGYKNMKLLSPVVRRCA